MPKFDLDRMDALHANSLALEIFVHAALLEILAETREPSALAGKTAARAKRHAENCRRQMDNAAIALPMEDRVADMARNLIISASGFTDRKERLGYARPRRY